VSASVCSVRVAPKGIEGGFVLVPVPQLLFAWRACRRGSLGIGAFRAWLACFEMVARRCTVGEGRASAYGLAELARLLGVSEKRARTSINRLVGAGLLGWSGEVIGFPEPGESDDALDDTIGGGKGAVVVPRRILRLLAGGSKPALIATALAVLLRCLSRGRGGCKARGRLKASFVARAFGVDLRRVKQARQDLVGLGWIAAEPTDQWAENKWGRAYRIDLGWDRATPGDGPRLPPPPAETGRRSPPPDLHDPEPFQENEKDQELASGQPAGVEILGGGKDPIPEPARSAPRARVDPDRRPTRPKPMTIDDGAGGGSAPRPDLRDIRAEDLKDTGRLLALHEQAVSRGLIGPSEADRLRFVAAAEHARAIGSVNPPGLFALLVRGRHWDYLTQDDEDVAGVRLKRYLFGTPKGEDRGVGLPVVVERPRFSPDAGLVREVLAATARAGHRGDPFGLVRARDSSWTRARWDAASAELGVATIMR